MGADGRVYLHYDNWYRWIDDRTREYPMPEGHHRLDIQLCYPRSTLEQVPITRDPHGGLGGHVCYYKSENWSTIFGAHSFNEGNDFKMLVESGCPDPVWGEKITLFSTSCTICDEPWGRNQANKFAFFRNQYWRVISDRLLEPWTPIRDEGPRNQRIRHGNPRQHFVFGFPPFGNLPAQTFTRFMGPILDDILDDIFTQEWSMILLGSNTRINWSQEGF